MSVALDTSRLVMSLANYLASENMLLMSVTLGTSHSDMSPFA